LKHNFSVQMQAAFRFKTGALPAERDVACKSAREIFIQSVFDSVGYVFAHCIANINVLTRNPQSHGDLFFFY